MFSMDVNLQSDEFQANQLKGGQWLANDELNGIQMQTSLSLEENENHEHRFMVLKAISTTIDQNNNSDHIPVISLFDQKKKSTSYLNHVFSIDEKQLRSRNDSGIKYSQIAKSNLYISSTENQANLMGESTNFDLNHKQQIQIIDKQMDTLINQYHLGMNQQKFDEEFVIYSRDILYLIFLAIQLSKQYRRR